MYSTPYGYPNPAGGPPFNGAPPQQNPHLQPGPAPGQPQQMMYNPQQFPMGTQAGHFPGGPNPAMMGAPGPAGMMQNAGMPHMAANGQMAFQAPFSGSPYGAGIPASAAPQVQLPGNYMMAGSMPGAMPGVMAPFQMNAGMAPQQPMMQRMHPSQANQQGMNAAPSQRPFNPSQGTPNNSMPPQHPQFSTPQQHGTPQNQTPTNPQQPPSASATPQTPTFPAGGQPAQANGTASVSTPQSPATESREKERFDVLLDINQELLYEVVSLCNSKAEIKKELAAAEAAGSKPNGVDLAEEERLTQQDWNHCMRRLHTNLAYMAALADRKSLQAPPAPGYLMPPPLNLKLKLRVPQTIAEDSSEKPPDPNLDREERDQMLKDLYKKLQALFPGVDPRKEQPSGGPNSRAAATSQQPNMAKGQNGQVMGAPGSNHGSPASAPPAHKTPQTQMGNSVPPMMQTTMAAP
ncbi:hypothetical protein QBC47DRAFT_66445 [Echria macrotheca]|uniref:Uncharacterized protein n=1 Tax=Echria macrotheca TaxID=438768 RepID=A0AAJ0B8I4_9PEZI|nr:hypothetical protein QBC47DRAFT_66445 [Echria macrotheca]